MAISFVGSSNGTTTITLPAHQAGDFIYVFMGHASATPGTPSGWTSAWEKTGNPRYRLVFKFATSSSETIAMTNTTAAIAVVYRGVQGRNLRGQIESPSTTSISYTTVVAPSVTDGTSWAVAFGIAGSTASTIEANASPLITTTRNSRIGTSIEITAKDNNGVGYTSSYSATTALGVSAATGTIAEELTAIPPKILAADGATLTLTGNNADLRVDSRLPADSAILALSGGNADLLLGRIMQVDGASLSLTGQPANLLRGRYLVADGAPLVLIGGDAAFQVGQHITADGAALALTGQAASLRVARRLIADGAALALTGQAAGLFHGRRLQADGAALALTGGSVDFPITRRLQADGAALALTGGSVNLLPVHYLIADGALLTLTGHEAILRRLTPFIPLNRYEGFVWNTYRLKEYQGGQWVKPRLLRYVGGSWIDAG